jgi:hypothetical protein
VPPGERVPGLGRREVLERELAAKERKKVGG